MNGISGRTKKVIAAAFVAASLLLSAVAGFGADDASAMRCIISYDGQQRVCELPGNDYP